jgi:hypothetical protein
MYSLVTPHPKSLSSKGVRWAKERGLKMKNEVKEAVLKVNLKRKKQNLILSE